MSDTPDYIFTPQKVLDTTGPKYDEFYGNSEDYDYLDASNNPRLNEDSNRTLAKKLIRDDGTYKYLVKTNASKKFYNPLSMYGKSEIGSTFLDKTCKDFKFKAVSQKIFDSYVNFLRTKNVSWLYNAEREAE